MKIKKIMFLAFISIGMMTLMSTTCEKISDEPTNCSGIASGTASGEVSASYCFDNLSTYDFIDQDHVLFFAHELSTEAGIQISYYEYQGVPPKTGTFQCGSDNGGGYIQLITPGHEEFYNSVSGTLTITNITDNSFEGSYDVTCEGYYNKKTITLKGTFSWSN